MLAIVMEKKTMYYANLRVPAVHFWGPRVAQTAHQNELAQIMEIT